MADTTEAFETAKQEVHALLDSLGIDLPAKAQPKLEEVYAKIKAGGMLPKDALGFPPELMELMYQYGYNLFQNGKYKEALVAFNTLRQLDVTDIRYTFSVAACHHHAKEYLDAAAHYRAYSYMDPLNPIPDYHLYDCFMKAGYPQAALYVLEEAIVLCARDSRYRELGEKAQLEKEHLKELLKANYEKGEAI